MALVEDSTTLSAYLDDFGVSCTSGSTTAKAILEQPDLVLAGNQIISTDYQLTAKASDFGNLIAGAKITIESTVYFVREVRRLDDGNFCEIAIQKR